ncbi:hypothetical protein BGZ94_003230, partial [Podila epigama]
MADSHSSGQQQQQQQQQEQQQHSETTDSPKDNTPSSVPLASTLTSTSSSSFYNSLDLEAETVQATTSPLLKQQQQQQQQQQPSLSVSSTSLPSPSSSPPSFAKTPTTPTEPTTTSTSPLNPSKFGTKKIRTGGTGSKISQRISALAAGKTENGSDQHTVTASTSVSNPADGGDGRTTPDPADYPDSFFEDLLRSDQTTISRSFTTMPKPTPRNTTLTHSSTMPLQTSRFGTKIGGTKNDTTTTTNGTTNENDTPVELSGDLEEDLKRLQVELAKTKEVKVKAEADAKAQRLAVMSLKTEVQLVRNVLKRKETELGDVK